MATKQFTMTVPGPIDYAYQAVFWAAENCGQITGGENNAFVCFAIDCGDFGTIDFRGDLVPYGESSTLTLVGESADQSLIAKGYEWYAKMLAETFDGIYGEASEESYFDGGLLQLAGWTLLGWLVTICTLGICYPWACCMVYGWEINHTVVNGQRMRFVGKATDLFLHWLLWLFLTVITLGIYGFWAGIKVRQWRVANTVFW